MDWISKQLWIQYGFLYGLSTLVYSLGLIIIGYNYSATTIFINSFYTIFNNTNNNNIMSSNIFNIIYAFQDLLYDTFLYLW